MSSKSNVPWFIRPTLVKPSLDHNLVISLPIHINSVSKCTMSSLRSSCSVSYLGVLNMQH